MSEATRNSKIAALWGGEVGLAKAFWLYGVLVTFCIWFFGVTVLLRLTGAGLSGTLFFSMVLISTAVGYQILVSVGVWRSAGKYQGKTAWSLTARLVIVLAALWTGADLWGLFRVANSNDPTRNSKNVAAQIDRNTKFPYSGFWKDSCTDNFGLVIEPSLQERGGYSVSFCGPGSCFAGHYRHEFSE
jgi:hypothetical protein